MICFIGLCASLCANLFPLSPPHTGIDGSILHFHCSDPQETTSLGQDLEFPLSNAYFIIEFFITTLYI